MYPNWKRVTVVAGLALSLLAWGCETPTAPPAAEPTFAAPEAGSELRFVGSLGAILSDSESKWIGPLGGTIEILGHELVVPAGAVQLPTLFVMIVLPTRNVQVELFAYNQLLGFKAGSGFEIPIQLSLSYARTNVTNPENLKIVHIARDGTLTVVGDEVDTEAQTVSAYLEHFSRYGMCSN